MSNNAVVCVIIRAYNNNRNVIHAVDRAFRARSSGVARVVVVVKNDDPATNGNVRAWLADRQAKNGAALEIIEMCRGYHWSPALNRGIEYVRHCNDLACVDPEQTPFGYILNMSIEAKLEPKHLEAMLEAMEQDPKVGAVGTSFIGLQNGNKVELGTSYVHPRNTLMLLKVAAVEQTGYFDSACDEFGGQEDLQFLFRMEVRGKYAFRRLDLKVPLVVGVNYDQASKERREIEAIRKIMAYELALAKRFRRALIDLGVEPEEIDRAVRTRFSAGDVVTWTAEAVRRSHDDDLDAALVRPGERLVVLKDCLHGDANVMVRSGASGQFPANPKAVVRVEAAG